MFDICCGGVIPAKIGDVVDFKKAPYLERRYPCNYCKMCDSYRWRAEYDLTELSLLFHSICPSVGQIKRVTIAERDDAGLVKSVKIRGRKADAIVTISKFMTVCRKVKSFCFKLLNKGGKLIISGNGRGHHIGLCQWGARNMVREGWGYRSILQFYYPGSTFMRLRDDSDNLEK